APCASGHPARRSSRSSSRGPSDCRSGRGGGGRARWSSRRPPLPSQPPPCLERSDVETLEPHAALARDLPALTAHARGRVRENRCRARLRPFLVAVVTEPFAHVEAHGVSSACPPPASRSRAARRQARWP